MCSVLVEGFSRPNNKARIFYTGCLMFLNITTLFDVPTCLCNFALKHSLFVSLCRIHGVPINLHLARQLALVVTVNSEPI